MKNEKYLNRLPIGEVVTNGRVLAAMKKRGLIEDYDSTFKYLDGNPYEMKDFEYKGNFFTHKYFDGCFNPYLVKDVPPMRWDRKTKKYYPQKRIYYKCFKVQFSHKKVGDDLAKNVWNLHYKVSTGNSFNSALFDYVCRKMSLLETTVRVRKPIKNRSICLWGAIV